MKERCAIAGGADIYSSANRILVILTAEGNVEKILDGGHWPYQKTNTQ